jgi:hypothetical protein
MNVGQQERETRKKKKKKPCLCCFCDPWPTFFPLCASRLSLSLSMRGTLCTRTPSLLLPSLCSSFFPLSFPSTPSTFPLSSFPLSTDKRIHIHIHIHTQTEKTKKVKGAAGWECGGVFCLCPPSPTPLSCPSSVRLPWRSRPSSFVDDINTIRTVFTFPVYLQSAGCYSRSSS